VTVIWNAHIHAVSKMQWYLISNPKHTQLPRNFKGLKQLPVIFSFKNTPYIPFRLLYITNSWQLELRSYYCLIFCFYSVYSAPFAPISPLLWLATFFPVLHTDKFSLTPSFQHQSAQTQPPWRWKYQIPTKSRNKESKLQSVKDYRMAKKVWTRIAFLATNVAHNRQWSSL
jgi:hypothetical protein